ncbi:hypothetical protein HDU96_003359, partial [Phlyctochytrium bullatum]
MVIGKRLKKDQNNRISNWSGALSREQVSYCVQDAVASLHIYLRAKQFGPFNPKNLLPGEKTGSRNPYQTRIKQLSSDNIGRLNRLINSSLLTDHEVDDDVTDEEDSLFYNSLEELNSIDLSRYEASASAVINAEILSPVNATTPEVTYCRVLCDPWHAMKKLTISKKHSLFKEFCRSFSQSMFIVSEEDKKAVVEYLASKMNMTFDEKFRTNPAWVLKRLRRWIPPPHVLYVRLQELFTVFGPLKCSKHKEPLFSPTTWKETRALLDRVQAGQLSDPADVPMYALQHVVDGLN